MSNPPAYPDVRPPRAHKEFPWLLFGCLMAVLVVLLLVVLAVAGFFAVRGIFTGLIENYTDTVPMELPESAMPAEEYAALEERLKTFRTALEQGTAVEPLALTAEDINALIQNDPDWKELRGHVHVAIEGNLISGTVSMPLDMFGLQGRYLNGTGSFSVSMRNSALDVRMDSLQVKGQSAPEAFMEGFRNENLARDYNREPGVRETLSQFESIEVRDGVLWIEPKASP